MEPVWSTVRAVVRTAVEAIEPAAEAVWPAVQANPLALVVVAVGLAVAVLVQRRRSSGKRRSRDAHRRAQQREPPVELGETYEFGVAEFTDHHSGARVAVGKVEGFVLFTEDVPTTVDEGDVIRAQVLSFNRGRTSADATFVERR